MNKVKKLLRHPVLAVVDSNFIESEYQVPEVAEEQHTFTEKEIQLVNDIGLWDDISEDIRNRWIAKGVASQLVPNPTRPNPTRSNFFKRHNASIKSIRFESPLL